MADPDLAARLSEFDEHGHLPLCAGTACSCARRLREVAATLAEQMHLAERACALSGWTTHPDDTVRGKAATQAWMEWAHARPEMVHREAWPDLTDEGIAALAAKRDETRRRTLDRIFGESTWPVDEVGTDG